VHIDLSVQSTSSGGGVFNSMSRIVVYMHLNKGTP
jgi:hypothetical protein